MWISWLNWLNAIIALAIGVYCTAWPRAAAAGLGIEFVHATGLTDFRATYGGLCLAFAAFWAAAAVGLLAMKEAMWLATFFYAGLFSIRAYGILVDGPQKPMMIWFLWIEIALAAASAYAAYTQVAD
jgi:hypothetical protein